MTTHSLAGGLPGWRDGVPERFVPAEMQGQIVEAEHIARYAWASQLVAGRRVLDAGCGVGYGASLLREAGAGEVVAVDISEAIVEVARQAVPTGVICEVADIQRLPYPDSSFDVVVCFEALEHVDDPEATLDEMRRVAGRDGLLVVSSPNRERYVPGNPHHQHEYVPDELREALERRFAAVRLFGQHLMVASVLSGDSAAGELSAEVRRMVTSGAEDQTYIVAVAGAHIPEVRHELVTLTHLVELRRWLELYAEQQATLHTQHEQLRELSYLRESRLDAIKRLAERERDFEEVTRLRADLAQAAVEAERLREAARAAERRAEHAERVMHEVLDSATWRATAPLRAVKQTFADHRSGR